MYKQWRFYVGARGAQAPQILPRPPKFLDTVVLLLVELIGSIVISLKFRLAVVASQMMRDQQARIQRGGYGG